MDNLKKQIPGKLYRIKVENNGNNFYFKYVKDYAENYTFIRQWTVDDINQFCIFLEIVRKDEYEGFVINKVLWKNKIIFILNVDMENKNG